MINRKLTILAIEDDQEDATLLRQVLEEIPGFCFEFLHHTIAAEGLRALSTQPIDITFLDHRLGASSATDLLASLRTAGDIRPVIVLTGQGDEQTAAQVMRAGADDYLVKNQIDPDALRRALEHAENCYRRRLAEQELSQANTQLADLLEREKQISTQLQEALRKTQTATRSKTEFLANMSHEIRTPMTAILGYIDLLMDPTHAPAQRQEMIKIIRRNGEHLLMIINDVLDVSKIEAGKLQVEQIECSPAQILGDVTSLMRDRAAAKNLALDVKSIGPIPKTIRSDPTRLRQILINLVSNAIKFTDEGQVRINTKMVETSDDAGPQISFEVIDSGIGMTPQQQENLFQAFSQGDTSTTRKFGGTGLGLVICKRLAEMMGGHITMACKINEGCAFIVTVATGGLDGVQMLDNLDKSDPANHAPDTSRHAITQLNAHILLAEDGPDNQRLISFVLQKAGATVELADNGRIAYEAAMKAMATGRPYDVILMDMQMPEMDGYTATRKLRSAGYKGPIIALTAHAMASDRDKCMNAGCDEFATKPLEKKKLLTLLARYTNADATTKRSSSAA